MIKKMAPPTDPAVIAMVDPSPDILCCITVKMCHDINNYCSATMKILCYKEKYHTVDIVKPYTVSYHTLTM